jgi:hypothetical protein
MKETKSVIYFLRSGDRVKIGVTISLGRRIKALESASGASIDLIGSIPGTKDCERELHEQFAEYRIKGEWFSATEELLTGVDQILKAAASLDDFVIEAGPLARQESKRVDHCIFWLTRLLHIEQCRGNRTTAAFTVISKRSGISHGTLWGLKYRRPAFVSAGTYFALSEEFLNTARDEIGRLSAEIDLAKGKQPGSAPVDEAAALVREARIALNRRPDVGGER